MPPFFSCCQIKSQITAPLPPCHPLCRLSSVYRIRFELRPPRHPPALRSSRPHPFRIECPRTVTYRTLQGLLRNSYVVHPSSLPRGTLLELRILQLTC